MGAFDVIEMIAANGVFAVLFFFLLMMEIKDSRRREEKYQNVVDRLSEELHIVKDVDDNVDEVLRRVISMDKGKCDEESK